MFTYQQLPFEDTEYLVLYENHKFAGAMRVRWNGTLRSHEVTEVAAEKKGRGIGTELYRLALSLYPSLVPCRVPGEIRGGAEAVWKSFYEGKNSELVEHEAITDGRHPKSKEWLNAKYSAEHLKPPPVEPFKKDEEAIDVIDRADKFLFNNIGFN